MFVKLMFLLVLKDEAEQCIGTGRFPIPNTNCSDYVVCTVFKNKLIGHIASCPDGTRFNPRSRLCSFGYACTDSVCQAADIEEGQSYLDPNDRNNGTYITCDFNEIYGTLTASYRSCPSHSVFQVSNASQYNRGMCLTNGNVYVGDIKDDASKFTEVITDRAASTISLAEIDIVDHAFITRLCLILIIVKFLT